MNKFLLFFSIKRCKILMGINYCIITYSYHFLGIIHIKSYNHEELTISELTDVKNTLFHNNINKVKIQYSLMMLNVMKKDK